MQLWRRERSLAFITFRHEECRCECIGLLGNIAGHGGKGVLM